MNRSLFSRSIPPVLHEKKLGISLNKLLAISSGLLAPISNPHGAKIRFCSSLENATPFAFNSPTLFVKTFTCELQIYYLRFNIKVFKQMTIVNKLKEYRNLRRLTQEELSKTSGISIRTIQRIEKGLSTGSPHTIKTLAKTLNIESAGLLVADENHNELASDQLGKVKLMNISILTAVFIPFGNLIFPTLIFLFNKKAKKVNTVGRKIISFQILSTLFLFLFTIILFMTVGRGNAEIPQPVTIIYILYVLICSITVIHSAIGINNGKEILKFAPSLI